MKRTLVLLGFIGLAASLYAASAFRIASRSTPAPGTPARAIEGRTIASPGRVEAASEEIEVGAEIRGRLNRVLVDEGDHVTGGQVLAMLDADDYHAAVASADARLAIARAEYDRLVNGSRPEERREADAERLQGEAAFAQAVIERDRRAHLYQDGALALEEFERADRDLRLASAKRDELTERALLVAADARVDETSRARAAIALAEAQLAGARATLGKTELHAPLTGTILHRERRAGELVAPEAGRSLVFVMADTSRLRVRADVDETDVAALAVGQRAWVSASAFGDRRFTGTVSRVGQLLGRKTVRTDEPTEKTDTKVLETLIDLDPGMRLPLGLRVDVFIDTGTR